MRDGVVGIPMRDIGALFRPVRGEERGSTKGRKRAWRERRADQGETGQAMREKSRKRHQIGRQPGKQSPRGRTGDMTLKEAKGQASTLARKFFASLERSETPPRGNVTAWGVAVDKWTILTGRPTEILRIQDADKARPKILRLAGKIGQLGRGENQSKSA